MEKIGIKFRFKGIRFYNEHFHKSDSLEGKKKNIITQLRINEHSLISDSERELKFHFKFSLPSAYTISFDGDVILETSEQAKIDHMIELNPCALECIAYENILSHCLNNIRRIASINRVMPPLLRLPVMIQKRALPNASQVRPIEDITKPSQTSQFREILYDGNWYRLKSIPDSRIITEIKIPFKPKFDIKAGNYQIGSELVNLTFEHNQTAFRIQRKIIEVEVDYSKLPDDMPPPAQVIPTCVIEYWNEILKQNNVPKQSKIRNIDGLPILVKYKLQGKEIAEAKYPPLKYS